MKSLIKKKICFAASVPTSINVFWRNQIILCKSLFDITIASISKNKSHLKDLNVRYKNIKIERNPKIFLDFLLLINFYRYLKNQNFYILHTQTPKAGFIFQFAAWITKVPVRIHTFTGQVWANKKGMSSEQAAGSANSYCRKYALGGFFKIDDSEEIDSMDNRNIDNRKPMTDDLFAKSYNAITEIKVQTKKESQIDRLVSSYKLSDVQMNEIAKIHPNKKKALSLTAQNQLNGH